MALVAKLNSWLGICYKYHIVERDKWWTSTTRNTTLDEIPHWSRLTEGIFHSLGVWNGFTMQQCEGDKFGSNTIKNVCCSWMHHSHSGKNAWIEARHMEVSKKQS